MIHIDDDKPKNKKPRKERNLSVRDFIFGLVICVLVFGIFAVGIMGNTPQKPTPVVSADTETIPSDAIVMHTGDMILNNYYTRYPTLVLSGINHTYSQQVIFTVYFVLGNDIETLTIYPVLHQTFNAAGVTYKLWAVNWVDETVTVERMP